jgi:hypothetical protein
MKKILWRVYPDKRKECMFIAFPLRPVDKAFERGWYEWNFGLDTGPGDRKTGAMANYGKGR